jgi:hypothetical protein
MIAKVVTVKAHNIWLTTGEPVRRRAAVEFVLAGLERGAFKPVLDRSFEPRRVCRRLFGLSHAAMARSSAWA